MTDLPDQDLQKVVFADTGSIINQLNCVQNCSSNSFTRSIGVYKFFLEESIAYKPEEVDQIQANEYTASILLKDGTIYSHYMEGAPYYAHNRV